MPSLERRRTWSGQVRRCAVGTTPIVPTSGLCRRSGGSPCRTRVSGAQGRHNPRVPLGASGRMISTRRAELGEADRRARHDKRTRTPCLHGLPASRKADRNEPGAGDSPADLCRGPARGSTMSSDCAEPISGGSLIWQANQAQVGTTTRSAQSAISRHSNGCTAARDRLGRGPPGEFRT
jgi:hypothetical protein